MAAWYKQVKQMPTVHVYSGAKGSSAHGTWYQPFLWDIIFPGLSV